MDELVLKLIIAAISSLIASMGFEQPQPKVCMKHHAHYHAPHEKNYSPESNQDEEDLT